MTSQRVFFCFTIIVTGSIQKFSTHLFKHYQLETCVRSFTKKKLQQCSTAIAWRETEGKYLKNCVDKTTETNASNKI